MYYGLKETTRFLKERACVAVYSVLDTASYHAAHPVHALLACCCDGQATQTSLASVLTEGLAFTPAAAREAVEAACLGLRPFLDVRPEPFHTTPRYAPTTFLYQPEGDPDLHRLSRPINLDWLVTARCPFSCTYCCVATQPAGKAPADELTTEEALAFLEDCLDTGIEVFTLSGGEPFLRPDLPDLIAYLLGRGAHVFTSTKMPLPPSTVAKLAAAGLPELQVSIDSAEAATADAMVGRDRHLHQAWRTVAQLQEAGISARVNAVVTSRNVAHIPELVREAMVRGVRKMTLSGYIRAFKGHHDAMFPAQEDLQRVAAEVTELIRGEDVEVTLFPTRGPRANSLASPTLSSCSGGRTGIVVGADGTVATCDRLLTVPQAVVGNVREARVMEIWNGLRMMGLVDPPRAAFADTQCATCDHFDQCNHRVRCYFRANLIHGTLFGPDFMCPKTAESPIRFF